MSITTQDESGRADSIAEAGIEEFVAVHYDRLIRLATLVCRDQMDSADAVQSGLEQAWRKRHTLRDETRLKPWLDRIIVRAAIRTSRRRGSLLGQLLRGRPSVDWIEPIVDERPQLDLRQALRRAILDLSADQRAVVVLHLHLGYSVDEVADLVGAPRETIRSRLRLARTHLRDSLQETER
jgi:RNA polymerase sigma-70 factor, ECF subfamily